MIDDVFARRVAADEVTLGEYLERLNAEARAWMTEASGRGAGQLVTDLEFWRTQRRITKASELAQHLNECTMAG